MLALALGGFAACSNAQDEATPPANAEKSDVVRLMTPDRMAELVKSFDADAKVRSNVIAFELREREVAIVWDEKNNRMRILTPIAPSTLLDEDILMRMAQANYDSVLDVRYAVADDLLWSVFIHPLGSLQQEDFISAIAQVVTSAETFGTSYTSGAMVFGGGDSSELLKALEKAANKTRDPI